MPRSCKFAVSFSFRLQSRVCSFPLLVPQFVTQSMFYDYNNYPLYLENLNVYFSGHLQCKCVQLNERIVKCK